jgi:transposase InsO family protein
MRINRLEDQSEGEQPEVRFRHTGDLVDLQKKDHHVGPIYKLKQKGATQLSDPQSKETSWETNKLVRMMEHLSIRGDGVLVATIPVKNRRREVVVCPQPLRHKVMTEKHKHAHLGVVKTTARIQLEWFWPGMHADIRRFVTGCTRCQQSKTSATKSAGERQHLYAGRPWQVLAIDLCGPFPKTPRGNTQILVMTDHFTRWADAIAIPVGKTETIATVLDERVFAYFGIPEEIHSDQGRQFESRLFEELCKIWRTNKTRTSPYRPQANSVVERLNRTLGASLRALLLDHQQQDWDLKLPQIMRGIRATPHQITHETANYLMMGREVQLPEDLALLETTERNTTVEDYAQELQERLRVAGEKLRSSQYRVRMEETGEPHLYLPGDKVWLKSYARKKGENPKLSAKYVGPYEVVEALPYHTYRVFLSFSHYSVGVIG